jgi:hypothetical protein
VQVFLNLQNLFAPCDWYIKNLDAFDQFSGKKILLYYEDIINLPNSEFAKLGEFLNLPQTAVAAFLDNLDRYFADSVAAYTKGGHASETTKTKDLKAHSRSNLTEQQEADFDNYYMQNYKKLTEKYLKRYINQ